jgi:hypothetical protein
VLSTEIIENGSNVIPMFEEQESAETDTLISVPVYNLETKKMIAFSPTNGWLDFVSKSKLQHPETIRWIYLEDLKQGENTKEDHNSDNNANSNDTVIPELVYS